MGLSPVPFVEPRIEDRVRDEGCAKLAPKTADYVTNHFDTRLWDLVTPRQGDVLLGTYAKCGTTWMQQILRYLLVDVPPDVHQDDLTFWVEFRARPVSQVRALNAQKHRRFLKHHLPQSYLPSSMRDGAVYIYVARDARDVVWSAYNHHANFSREGYERVNSGEYEGPPFIEFERDCLTEVDYFRRWLESDGYPWWPFWAHIRSWWAVRHHPRVLLVHFANLKRRPKEEITRIYRFLKHTGDVREGTEEQVVGRAVHHSTFDYMKRNADRIVPGSGVAWNGGGGSFVFKGTNGRWRDSLPEELSQKYEQIAIEQLGQACAHWLKTGEGDCNL